MAFIEVVSDGDAPGAVQELFDEERTGRGYVPNYLRLLGHRPDVYQAWGELVGSIRANMDPRRYELATIAAARRLRSTYCMLAHGKVLMDGLVASEAMRAIAVDHHSAGLDEIDVAVMDFADKIVTDAASVTQGDVDRLRELGLTDLEVLDVALAASARCFFSKAIDALGVEADAAYAELEPMVREALTVGRPIDTG
jgi:uncharacterized peroxidase-related enzyme